MAVDPDISLNIKTPDNPLVLAGQISQSMMTMNGMQARQRLGQIISSAPDLETGMAKASQDPLVAAYGGEAMNSMRQMMLAQTQQQGELQKQFFDGSERMGKVFGAFAGDPGMAQRVMPSIFAGVNPQIQSRLAAAYQNANMALVTDNKGNYLPHNSDGTLTAEGQAMYFQNSAGMAAAAGMTPDQFALGAGKPGMVGVKYGEQPIRTLASGQVIKTGDVIPYGTAPSVTDTGQYIAGTPPGYRPGDPLPPRSGTGQTGTVQPPPPTADQSAQVAPTFQTAAGERSLMPVGTEATPERMMDLAHRESFKDGRLQNIDSAPDPKTGKKSTASGYFQMTDGTWQEGAKLAGIDTSKYPRAMDDPNFADQYAAAQAIFNKYGEAPWRASISNSRLPVPGPRGGGPGPAPAPTTQPAAVTSAQPGPALTTPTPTPTPQGGLGQRPAPAPTTVTQGPTAPDDSAPSEMPTRPQWLQSRTTGVPIAPTPAEVAGLRAGTVVGPQGASGVPQTIAGDGKPLWADGTSFKGPERIQTLRYDAAGNPIPDFKYPTDAKANDKAMEDWNTKGLDQYNSAQDSLMSLKTMRTDLENMMNQRLLTPGTGAEFRATLAKEFNTLASMIGMEQPFPSGTADVESFQKEMSKMGVAVGKTYLGGQREAAQTIEQLTKTVPGVENSYQGARVIMSTLEARFQRIVDERNYTNEFRARNGGALVGADEQFNSDHPAGGYIDRALAPFRLAQNINSDDSAGWLYQHGYIDKQQYRGAIKSLGGGN